MYSSCAFGYSLVMEEEKLLGTLDSIVRQPEIAQLIQDSIARLKKKLKANPNELFVWETIPLSHFSERLPELINSCWIFLIRSGLPPEKHRHPNSRQRTLSWQGSGDLQVSRRGRWSSNPLVSNPETSLQERWVSIPANAWHRPVVTSDWAVVSF